MTRHRIELSAPAERFEDSFLLGDGRLGAAVHGRADGERIDLNLDTFWSGGPLGKPAEDAQRPAAHLPELRDAIREGRWQDAEDAAMRLQGDGWSQSFQPIGALEWAVDAPGDALDYRRALDLSTATAETTFARPDGATVTTTAYVAAAHGVLVVERRGGPLGMPRLRSPHPLRSIDVTAAGPDARAWGGRAPSVALPNYVPSEQPIVYADDLPDERGRVAAGMGFAVVAALLPARDGVKRLLVTVADGFRGRRERPSADLEALAAEAVERLRSVAELDPERLRAEHLAEHRRLYDRMDLRLEGVGSEADELLLHLGRYLLITGSRTGTQPLNLQGIWNADPRPGWSSNYTTNINLEMNYWPAHVAGLGETALPLDDFVADLADLGSATARDYYDADGWALHHNADLWGFSAPVRGLGRRESAWANWPTGGLWLAAQIAERWDFEPALLDDPATAMRYWPVIAGAAAFASALLEEHADGRLIVNPSTSPEHEFRVPGGTSTLSAGAALDQELVHAALQRLLQLADHCDLDAECASFVERVRAVLPRLRPPQVGPDGLLQEWAEPWEPWDRGHRHLSHLYGLFPGSSIDADEDPIRFGAAVAALRDRIDHGSGYTGWSQGWLLCIAARIGDPELVAEALDILAGPLSSSSMLDLHPIGDPADGASMFQIDGNLGAAAGIVEALMQSRRGRLRLLPAPPRRWSGGAVRDVLGRGGHRVSLTWDRTGEVHAVVARGSDGPVRVELGLDGGRRSAAVLPGFEGSVEIVEDGRHEAVIWDGPAGGELRLRWSAPAHERTTAHPAG